MSVASLKRFCFRQNFYVKRNFPRSCEFDYEVSAMSRVPNFIRVHHNSINAEQVVNSWANRWCEKLEISQLWNTNRIMFYPHPHWFPLAKHVNLISGGSGSVFIYELCTVRAENENRVLRLILNFHCSVACSSHRQTLWPWKLLVIFSLPIRSFAQFEVYRINGTKNSKHKVNNLPSALFSSNNVETIFAKPFLEFTFCWH